MKILVPTAPGGNADTLARMVAQHMSRATGQQFYVENRGGAGNTLGIESVARAPADGYTFLLGASTITINHLVYKRLPYDVLRDFAPVTQLVSLPNVLVVHPSQPHRTLNEYIVAAKAKPGQINYASAGVGSNLHLAMELLKHRTGIDVTHVPYKGVGPALQDTLAGHVMSMMSNAASAKPHVDQGTLRALAVTSRERIPAMADVPSVAETGVTGYEVLNWFGRVRAGWHAGADRRRGCTARSPHSCACRKPRHGSRAKVPNRLPASPRISRPSCATKSRNGTRSARPPTSSRPNSVSHHPLL